MRKVFGIVAMGLLLAGCSISRNSFIPPPAEVAPSAISLKNASVYIYCFLDVRASTIGREMLQKFDSLLVQRLNAEHIGTATVHFPSSTGSYYRPYVNEPVPVFETIKANAAGEKAAHAQYRLVLFPSESAGSTIDRANSVRAYTIRWDLYDTSNGKLVWSTQSVGSQASLLFGSEKDPSVRAALIVDGFMAELKKSGLI